MRDIVSAVFSKAEDAEKAVSGLLDIGVPREAIAVVARGGEVKAHGGEKSHSAGDAGKGALAGLGIGAGVGALFGLAALAIPGVGPFIAGGALAETLGVMGGAAASGAIVGGTAGTVAGALSHWGLNEAEARHYGSEIERGGTYVGVDLHKAPVSRAIVVEAFRKYGGRVEDVEATAGTIDHRVEPPPVADVAGPLAAAGVMHAPHPVDAPQAHAVSGMEASERELRVPLTEEVAQVQKVRHPAGDVGVTKRLETETRHISEPVIRAEIVTESREVAAGENYRPDGRNITLQPGESVRIAVVEEELVIQKVQRVTREVVIHAQPRVELVERDVELQRERVDVTGAQGAYSTNDPDQVYADSPVGPTRDFTDEVEMPAKSDPRWRDRAA